MADSATRSPKQRPIDDETAAALTLYNTYLVADREQQAQERALKKAEKAKDDAAAAVRKLNDREAPASEISEAEAAYRQAAEALRHLRDGDRADPPNANAGTEAGNAADDSEADAATDPGQQAPTADTKAATDTERDTPATEAGANASPG